MRFEQELAGLKRQVNIRFKIVSSRLISAFDAPMLVLLRSGIFLVVPSLRVTSDALKLTTSRHGTRIVAAAVELVPSSRSGSNICGTQPP